MQSLKIWVSNFKKIVDRIVSLLEHASDGFREAVREDLKAIWQTVQAVRNARKRTLEHKVNYIVKDVWKDRAEASIAALTAAEMDGPEIQRLSNLFKDDGDMLREIVTAHDCFLTLSVHLRVEFTDKALREVPAFFLDAACAGFKIGQCIGDGDGFMEASIAASRQAACVVDQKQKVLVEDDDAVNEGFEAWELMLTFIKASATKLIDVAGENFHSTLLVKRADWPEASAGLPGFEAMHDSEELLQNFCDAGSVDEQLSKASELAVLLGKVEMVTSLSMEAAKDRVRKAVCLCWLSNLKEPKVDGTTAVENLANLSTLIGRLRELFEAVHAFGALARDESAPGVGSAEQNKVFMDASRTYLSTFVRKYAETEECKLKLLSTAVNGLYPSDWLDFCFDNLDRNKARAFINDQKTSTIGKQTTLAKGFCDRLSDRAFDQVYLMEWVQQIRLSEEGRQPGAYVDLLDEIRKAREALAGAKVSKICQWTVPGLPQDSEFKKKKRDWVKSGREAINNIGVASTIDKKVPDALTKL